MTGRKEDEPASVISIVFNIIPTSSLLTYLHKMMVVMMVDHGVRMDSIVGGWVHRSRLTLKIFVVTIALFVKFSESIAFTTFTFITFTCEVDMAWLEATSASHGR